MLKKRINRLFLLNLLLFSLIKSANAQDAYLGEIRIFAGNYAPKNWMICDGSSLSISGNTALFSLLGTTYGGNGTTSFNIPDLRGRFPLGTSNTYVQGNQGGNEKITLTTDNLPTHTHTLNVYNGSATESALPSTTSSLATPLSGTLIPANSTYSTQAPNTSINSATIGSTGNDQPIKIMPPYLPINFIICVSGIYPPRP